MGCPLSPQEVEILNGMPLSPYEQDILDNMNASASTEWRTQVAWLNSDRKENSLTIKDAEKGQSVPKGTRRQREIELEADKRRLKLVEFMESNGGSITVSQARAVFGGAQYSCYKPMDMLVKAGIAEVYQFKPRIWRLLK